MLESVLEPVLESVLEAVLESVLVVSVSWDNSPSHACSRQYRFDIVLNCLNTTLSYIYAASKCFVT